MKPPGRFPNRPPLDANLLQNYASLQELRGNCPELRPERRTPIVPANREGALNSEQLADDLLELRRFEGTELTMNHLSFPRNDHGERQRH